MCLAVIVIVTACDSQPETIAESDVPQIPGLENRYLSPLDRDGETLVGARALYRGEMVEPESVAKHTIERYRAHGWTLEERRIAPTCATLVFSKGERRVEVDLKANQLNPAMGIGSLDLHRQGAGARPPAATSAPDAPRSSGGSS